MNIRSIANIFVPTAIKPKDRFAQESSKDRDPARGGDGGEQQRRALTEDEVTEVLSIIRELPGFKQNLLQLRLVQDDGITVVYIENPDGKVVKRLTEIDLDQLLTSGRNKKKGNLVNKSA